MLINYEPSKWNQVGTMPRALSPSEYFDSTLEFSHVDDEESALGPSEILYTARGVQGLGIEQKMVETLNLDTADYKSRFIYADF